MLCKGLAVQAKALFAHGDPARARDCLRLQEVMLHALLAQGTEGARWAAASATAAPSSNAPAIPSAAPQARDRGRDPEGKHKG